MCSFLAHSDLASVLDSLQGDENLIVGPVAGSFPAVAAAMLSRQEPVLFVTSHWDDADDALAMFLDHGIEASVFPAIDNDAFSESVASRYNILEFLLNNQPAKGLIIAPVFALMQLTPSPSSLGQFAKRIKKNQFCSLVELQEWLVAAQYQRCETIEEAGQFSVRGGIVDIATSAGDFVRLDFLGDVIDAINEVDPISLGSDLSIDEILIASNAREVSDDTLFSYLKQGWCLIQDDLEEFYSQAESYLNRAIDCDGLCHIDDLRGIMNATVERIIGCKVPPASGVDVELPITPLPSFSVSPGEAISELSELCSSTEIVVTCQTQGEFERMNELTQKGHPLHKCSGLSFVKGFVQRGFLVSGSFGVVPSHEIFHRYELRRAVRCQGRNSRKKITEFDVGDIVVHQDFGIGEFLGLKQLKEHANQDFLTIQYANNRTLHVPVTHSHLVQRYIGAFKGKPVLTVLGGSSWSKQKLKATNAVIDLAKEMLRVQAIRESSPGIVFEKDTELMREFESSFPWEETEDQNEAIKAVKSDMMSPRPMDRLICGDVGFGKTEIAIRAAFKAVESGRQVAILVPTTVLAIQHERTLLSRLSEYPFSIESLTRFKSTSEQREIVSRCAIGKVDILVGTHRILSQDMHFSNLGLIVIDEEQRFGVEHKQKLLNFRAEADVLTLTATPIPRTLHMALLGIRDISSLQTAPVDRRAVVTEIKSWDSKMIATGIRREIARGGQVFYVHNRVYDIESIASRIRELVPEAQVIVGHGQMSAKELEQVMLAFVRGKADVLVSTTIIESGIDIPNANTMFIDDADRFGLSDLHQLRGRVGRYKHRAYCTLMLPEKRFVNPTARKRLYAIEKFSMLGAGFQIAIKDLEIRGAGNLLGAEQSGHIAAVGYDMYCQLLHKSVKELKDGVEPKQIQAVIDLGSPGRIPSAYIASDSRRLNFYRRLAQAESLEAMSQIVSDLESGYGKLPVLVSRIICYHSLRIMASSVSIYSLIMDAGDIAIKTSEPKHLEKLISSSGSLRRVGSPTPSGVFTVYYRPAVAPNNDDWISCLHQIFASYYLFK